MKTFERDLVCALAGFMLTALLPAASAAYRLETVALPPAMSPEVSGVAFSPEGDLFLCNRLGEIWRREAGGERWTRFASGLHEPLGLMAESSRIVFVVQRPELTRIEDREGDGVADDYTAISGEWGLTGGWHEFAYGLRRDPEGNFVGALGLTTRPQQGADLKEALIRGPLRLGLVHNEGMRSHVLYRGWSFKVTPQGEFIPWSLGFRQPAGIAVSPEGEVFSTENQGDWVGSSSLVHHKQGHFYGHPASLLWAGDDLPVIESGEDLGRMRTPPAVIFPHGAVGGSPGEPVWDETEGKFGPFAGQIFVGDFHHLVSRVFLEKVDGEYQGAVFPFFRHPELRQGIMRMAFGPDGALYLGQTSRGWARGWAVEGEGLQRIVWEGRTPVEVHSIRLRDGGFALEFTTPMDAAIAGRKNAYRVRRFRYLHQRSYGSPRIDDVPVAVTGVSVSDDGRRVELALAEVLPGFVYEFQLEELATPSGELLVNPAAFYTVNRLHNGERFAGPYTRPILPWSEAMGPIDIGAGKRVYQTYCLACHGEDGAGGGGGTGAPNFIADRSRLAKSDAELLRSIRRGVEEAGMPPFGSSLSEQDIQNVLAYIRDAFDYEVQRQRNLMGPRHPSLLEP